MHNVIELCLFDIRDVDRNFIFYRWWMSFIFVAYVMLVIYSYFVAYVILDLRLRSKWPYMLRKIWKSYSNWNMDSVSCDLDSGLKKVMEFGVVTLKPFK